MKQILITFLKRQFRSGGFITAIILFGGMMAFLPKAFGPSGLMTAGAMMGTGVAFAMLLGWGLTFSAIKNSSIMNGILTSSVSKKKFILASLMAAGIMMLVIGAILVCCFVLFVGVKQIRGFDNIGVMLGGDPSNKISPGEVLKGVDWGMIVVGIFLAGISSTSIAFFIGSVLVNPIHTVTASWIYAIALFFFGGASAPISLIRGLSDIEGSEILAIFKYLGYFMPNSFTNFLLADAASGSNIPLIALIPKTDIIVNTLSPVAYTVTLAGIGAYVWNK